MSLGLPYLVLSATGPLLQEWFRRTSPGASPYRLYALSNVGSLLALISYPFYFETNFTRLAQAQFSSWGLVFYAACCAFCAWRVIKTSPTASASSAPTTSASASLSSSDLAASPSSDSPAPHPTVYQRVLWLCLPACASILLLAVTNKMCRTSQSFRSSGCSRSRYISSPSLISFDSPRWYSRFWFTLLLVVAMVAICHAIFEGADMPIVRQVVIYSATMFVGAMICHGELSPKPHPSTSRLTTS